MPNSVCLICVTTACLFWHVEQHEKGWRLLGQQPRAMAGHNVHRHSGYSSAAVLQINISCFLSFFSRLSKLFTADTCNVSVTLGILTTQNPSGDVCKVESGSMKLCKEKCLKGWNYRNRFLWLCSFKTHILTFKNMWLHWVRLVLKHWADSRICSQALHGEQICLLIT